MRPIFLIFFHRIPLHRAEKMRVVRPVVETGYENVIQVRLLLDGIDPKDMLESWGTMLPKAMEDLRQVGGQDGGSN